MDNKEPVAFDFYQFIRNSSMTKASIAVFTSDAPNPPVRKDMTVKKLCEIHYEVDTPWENMNTRGGVRVIDDLALTMRFQGEPKWSLKTGKNHVEQSVNVQYTATAY